MRFRGQYDVKGAVFLEGPHHLDKLTPGRNLEAVWPSTQGWKLARLHSIAEPIPGRGQYAVQVQ